MPSRRGPGVLLAVLLAVLGLAVLAACGASTAATSTATGPGGGASVSDAADLAPSSASTDLDLIAVDQLPPEGVGTLRLIASNGPFPFAKDGVTFQNREGILPQQKSDFYREYTVLTPGSSDRGARRIIGGADGSRFYTDDHYSSFREVVSGVSS